MHCFWRCPGHTAGQDRPLSVTALLYLFTGIVGFKACALSCRGALAYLTRGSLPAAQEEIFRRLWGLRDVLNRPRRRATYLSAELAQFVRQHKCRRWETLASVAVQYGSDVAALRRLNNLMSDDALRSRVRVYVPGD